MTKDPTKIRLFAMDVDGTLTDGKIYMGETGELMKSFDVKDGLGIKLLMTQGIRSWKTAAGKSASGKSIRE